MSVSKNVDRVRAKRLRFLISVSAVTAAVILGSGYWIHTHVPESMFWQASLVLLIGIEITYCVALASILIAAPVFGACSGSRGEGANQPVGNSRADCCSASHSRSLWCWPSMSAACGTKRRFAIQ